MNVVCITSREIIEPDMADFLAAIGRADLIPAPRLSYSIPCGHCNCESPQTETEQAAIGSALGAGWHLRIPSGFKLEGFFDVEHLERCEAICPRCFTAEFETE